MQFFAESVSADRIQIALLTRIKKFGSQRVRRCNSAKFVQQRVVRIKRIDRRKAARAIHHMRAELIINRHLVVVTRERCEFKQVAVKLSTAHNLAEALRFISAVTWTSAHADNPALGRLSSLSHSPGSSSYSRSRRSTISRSLAAMRLFARYTSCVDMPSSVATTCGARP